MGNHLTHTKLPAGGSGNYKDIIMKYPAIYIYKKTSDKGRELKYSIRSLANLTNWNGQIFVVGDKEDWFDNITVIEAEKSAQPHLDRNLKIASVIKNKNIPDDFIFMNDDFYIMEKTELKPMYQGLLSTKELGNWANSKRETSAYLEATGVREPLNYDIHVPMVFNKDKLSEVMSIAGETTLLPRSLYGNLFSIGGVEYKDQKTRTDKLAKAPFVSTNRYTPELDKSFPNKSEFEL